MFEGISQATNNDEQDRRSHLAFIQDISWSLIEINTIIRKGILFLEN
jgi:hypothetical protein